VPGAVVCGVLGRRLVVRYRCAYAVAHGPCVLGGHVCGGLPCGAAEAGVVARGEVVRGRSTQALVGRAFVQRLLGDARFACERGIRELFAGGAGVPELFACGPDILELFACGPGAYGIVGAELRESAAFGPGVVAVCLVAIGCRELGCVGSGSVAARCAGPGFKTNSPLPLGLLRPP
jgi:hypothetical protein